MAKDKSKKTASSGTFAKPSEATGGGDAWKFETDENLGELFLINPLREEDFTSEDYGTSKIIVADIVHLNEKKPEKSEAHADTYVFGAWVKGSLRSYIGNAKVLGRLNKGEKTKGKSAPWILEDFTDADVAIAEAYLDAEVRGAVADLGGTKAEKKSKKSKA